ncbi:hypothetical protein ACX2JU_002973, partial [Klebsiella variicola]
TINLLSWVNSADRYACSDHYFLSGSLKITGEYDEENHTQRSHFFICITSTTIFIGGKCFSS